MNDTIIKNEFLSFPEDKEAFKLYQAYESGNKENIAESLKTLYDKQACGLNNFSEKSLARLYTFLTTRRITGNDNA